LLQPKTIGKMISTNQTSIFLPLSLLALLLLPACSKAGRGMEAGEEEIVFRTEDNWGDGMMAFEPSTKGAQKMSFGTGDKMVVYAYHVPSGGSLSSSGTKYFEGQEVTYGGSAWTYSPAHYYPVSGSLYFRAFYPAASGSNGISLSSAASGLTISYAVPSNIANHPDLMVASADGKSSGNVDLTFTHILSAVKFTTETSGLTITGVTFSGIYSSGSYDYSTWSNLSSAEKTFTYTAGQCLMLIPQTFEAGSTAKITVSYTKDSTPGSCEISLADTAWTAGGSYSYKLG